MQVILARKQSLFPCEGRLVQFKFIKGTGKSVWNSSQYANNTVKKEKKYGVICQQIDIIGEINLYSHPSHILILKGFCGV